MKKTLTVFAALMLVALAVPHSALAYDFSAVAPSGQTLYYNIVDGNAQVTSSQGSYAATGDLVIPSSVVYNGNSYNVTSIGSLAFEYCSGLTSVTIPNSVTSIGTAAFSHCSGLTSVTIPNSVTSIGSYAFRDCSGLTSIVVDEGNTHYDSRDNCNAIIQTNLNLLVQGCNTTVIPTSVNSIGDGAFSGCSGLTSVTIPESVTSIGFYAFYPAHILILALIAMYLR